MSKENSESQRDESIIPQAREFMREVRARRKDPELSGQDYGHAIKNLANNIGTWAALPYSTEEKQIEILREGTLKLLKKFGPNILNVMKEELKLSLTEEDLEAIKSNRS